MKLLEEFNKVKAENKNCIVFIKSGAGVSTKILDSSLNSNFSFHKVIIYNSTCIDNFFALL